MIGFVLFVFGALLLYALLIAALEALGNRYWPCSTHGPLFHDCAVGEDAKLHCTRCNAQWNPELMPGGVAGQGDPYMTWRRA